MSVGTCDQTREVMVMKKKTKHAGLYRLTDGRYHIRATAVCQRTGKMKETTKTLEQDVDEDDALIALRNLKRDLRLGTPVPGAVRRITVADYAEQWLEAKARRVRPAVAGNYESALASYILPILGELFVDAVTRAEVERWVAWAEHRTLTDGRPYARDTLHGWWRVLAALLRDATAELRLPLDPTYRVRPPQSQAGKRREMKTLTAKELGSLLRGVHQYSPKRYAEVYTMAFTGMRAGELYALHWDDIDEERGVVHIRRSVWRGHVTPTKTSSPRDVALTPRMAEILREHRKKMMASQHPGFEQGIVFPSDRGTYRVSSSLHKALSLAAGAAGIDVKVAAQALRRTFNTLLMHAGVDRIVLRSQMGHSSEEMTMRYSGISVEAKQAAVGQLELLTERGKET